MVGKFQTAKISLRRSLATLVDHGMVVLFNVNNVNEPNRDVSLKKFAMDSNSVETKTTESSTKVRPKNAFAIPTFFYEVRRSGCKIP